MVPKPQVRLPGHNLVLELCCFEWFQNLAVFVSAWQFVLELCCFEWFQNTPVYTLARSIVLELCCFEWFQNYKIVYSLMFVCFRAVLVLPPLAPHRSSMLQ